jgi:hypothetical protein
VKAQDYKSSKMINEDFHALLENYKEQYKDPGFKYMSDIERAADEINSHIDNYKIAKYNMN